MHSLKQPTDIEPVIYKYPRSIQIWNYSYVTIWD